MKFRLCALLVFFVLAARIARGGSCVTGGPGNSPLALPDEAYVTAVGAPVTIPVLSNDYSGGATTVAISAISAVTAAGGGPAPGTVIRNADNTLRYTPSALTDAAFTYTIVNPQMPNSPSAPAVVSIHASSTSVQIIRNCTDDGWCTFTAIPSATTGILSYRWTWGDSSPGQPLVAGGTVNHLYGGDGHYTVSVTVTYSSSETRSASISFDIHLGRRATFRLTVGDGNGNGLGVTIDNIFLCVPEPPNPGCTSTFPAGTKALINWSPNAADCSWWPRTNGCGMDGAGPRFEPIAGDCQIVSCRATGLYSRTGTYTATLRFATPTTVERDYPLVVTVNNAPPQPSFTISRPDPNRRIFSFNGRALDDGPFPLRAFEWDFGDGTTFTESDPAPPPTPPAFDHPAQHTYPALGNYTVALKVADGDGKSTLLSQPLSVTNANPAARMTVDCAVTDCEFSGDGSTDDGDNITQWNWTFGDGGTSSGAHVTRHYQPGCYPVTLSVRDADGGISPSVTTNIAVGPPVFTQKFIRGYGAAI